ncbi:MAG: LysR family transcriptional regulator [Clostridia bacterium]|nr:LysR family transcriptional regulator [Clostridia bacterium]
MVNLDLYRVFYAVAKCGSLSKAADELFISQPAVSQSIKQLEAQLGGKLFIRTPKGMELTEKEGRLIFSYVKKIMDLCDVAENEFYEMKQQASGILTIAASDTICKYYLLDYIEQFHKKHPYIMLNVLNRTTAETIELLKNGKADLGIVNLPIESPDIEMIFLCQSLHHIFVGGRKYADLAKKVMPLKELENYPLIMLELSSNTRKMLVNFFHSLGIHLHPDIELGSFDVLKGFARADLGITTIPREYCLRNLREGSLVEIQTDPCLPVTATGVIRHKRIPPTFAVKEFLNILREPLPTENNYFD